MPPPDDLDRGTYRGITREQRGLPATPLLNITDEEYAKAVGTFTQSLGRGLDSSLVDPDPGPEQVWVSDLGLAVGECSKVPELGGGDPLTAGEIHEMHRACALMTTHSGTPCLVKLA